mmetsp:Transcript_27496/g.81915  ORF Transcript_27496/g.81915 Transcript_27496/m.81915 type:complete len:206 (-) Transcript_27496:991-1608(-)
MWLPRRGWQPVRLVLPAGRLRVHQNWSIHRPRVDAQQHDIHDADKFLVRLCVEHEPRDAGLHLGRDVVQQLRRSLPVECRVDVVLLQQIPDHVGRLVVDIDLRRSPHDENTELVGFGRIAPLVLHLAAGAELVFCDHPSFGSVDGVQQRVFSLHRRLLRLLHSPVDQHRAALGDVVPGAVSLHVAVLLAVRRGAANHVVRFVLLL